MVNDSPSVTEVYDRLNSFHSRHFFFVGTSFGFSQVKVRSPYTNSPVEREDLHCSFLALSNAIVSRLQAFAIEDRQYVTLGRIWLLAMRRTCRLESYNVMS